MFSLNTYCDSFIMSIMSFLMHPWCLSCASACNRCIVRSDPAGIRGTERGAAAANTGGSWGPALGRSADEVAVECSDHRLCNIVNGKPRSILSLLIFEMQLRYYCYIYIYIVALSLGVGCKHLLHWLPNSLSRYYYPESYVAQARVVLSPA